MLNDERPLISVIVPIYNVEEYIIKCLSSIKNQTYQNIEVILINDGSTDKSGDMAENFARNNNRFYFFSKENGGLSSARNEGLRRAKGEYVYFLDSDDWIQSDYLEELEASFERNTDIVIGKYTLDDTMLGKMYTPFKDEKIDTIFSGEEKEKEIIERHINAYPRKGYIIKNTLMPVWKNMYRRKFLLDNNIWFVSERIVGAEDYVFNFEAYYYAKEIKFSEAAGCVHVIVPGSLSRKFDELAFEKSVNRIEVVSKSIEEKVFYDKNRVLEALECEKMRLLLGRVYNIISANINNKVDKIKKLLKNVGRSSFFKKRKKPNIQQKYLLIYYMLKYCGVYITYVCITIAKRGYVIYRNLEYINRR